jgi:AbrB family looped-hinge helix DNA binding protein
MKSVVSEKGQVTIPKEIRDRLGIKPGQSLQFSAEGGKLIAIKTDARDAVDRVSGILRLDGTVDEIIRSIRGEDEP